MSSLFETLAIICLAGLTSDYGIKPAFSLASIALIFLYGINLLVHIVYQRFLRMDHAFKYWE